MQVGDSALRQAAKELSPTEIRSREIQELLEWMRETMHDAPGVGLAAPQVGLSLQLAVIEDRPEYMKDAPSDFLKERGRKPVPFHVVINPKITLDEGTKPQFFEGCLSLHGYTALVSRAEKVRVDCLDHKGEPKVIHAAGWYARILQHEIDHLHGTLYIDRMLPRSFMSMENFNRSWKDKSVDEVRRLLSLK